MPELNGRAERRNRMHIEGTTMLKDSKLGKDLWDEACRSIFGYIYSNPHIYSSSLISSLHPLLFTEGQ